MWLVIYLLSATAFTELLRLPVLVTHYYHHKEINRNIGIILFLKQHYSSAKNNNNNSKEDNQLPFKSTHTYAVNLISLPALISCEISTKKEWLKITSFYIPNHLQLPDKFAANIWQPPRI